MLPALVQLRDPLIRAILASSHDGEQRRRGNTTARLPRALSHTHWPTCHKPRTKIVGPSMHVTTPSKTTPAAHILDSHLTHVDNGNQDRPADNAPTNAQERKEEPQEKTPPRRMDRVLYRPTVRGARRPEPAQLAPGRCVRPFTDVLTTSSKHVHQEVLQAWLGSVVG
jgi:hypothetical protein